MSILNTIDGAIPDRGLSVDGMRWASEPPGRPPVLARVALSRADVEAIRAARGSGALARAVSGPAERTLRDLGLAIRRGDGID